MFCAHDWGKSTPKTLHFEKPHLESWIPHREPHLQGSLQTEVDPTETTETVMIRETILSEETVEEWGALP